MNEKYASIVETPTRDKEALTSSPSFNSASLDFGNFEQNSPNPRWQLRSSITSRGSVSSGAQASQPRVQGRRPKLTQPHPMVVHEEDEDDGDMEERVEAGKSAENDSMEA